MSGQERFTFTVFTPTYNRRHLLGRVYRSLCAQTFLDFEWLIVDDGSSDDTAQLVAEWIEERRLAIRYFYQPNQGKHRAYGRALDLARSEFFTVLDSDDEIVPHALERLLYHWATIPVNHRREFSGVTCLCVDQAGKVVGRAFPKAILDCRHFEAYTLYGVRGEKWGFHRTAVVRQFPFPKINEERYCDEGLVWNRIGREFKMRHVNEPLRIYFQHKESLTPRMDRIRVGSPQYARLYYQEYLALDIPLRYQIKNIANYIRFSLHVGLHAREFLRAIPHHHVAGIVYPVGWLAFVVDHLVA